MPHASSTPSSDPRYPVGRFARPANISAEDRRAAIATLAELPAALRNALEGLDRDQLDTPYREGGWAVRQLVHHIADSHMQAFLRVRLALTENSPEIKAYDEKLWAELADSRTAPASWSLSLLEHLHARWVLLLQSLTEEQWQRRFVHPQRGPSTVEEATLMYAWHSRHHLAHITRLREQRGWRA